MFLNQKLIWSRNKPLRLGSSEKSNAPPFHIGKTRHLWFHSNSVWHDNIDSRRFSINKSSFGLIWFNSWWFESVSYHRETWFQGFSILSSFRVDETEWFHDWPIWFLFCWFVDQNYLYCVIGTITHLKLWNELIWIRVKLLLSLYLYLYPRYSLNLLNYNVEWTKHTTRIK